MSEITFIAINISSFHQNPEFVLQLGLLRVISLESNICRATHCLSGHKKSRITCDKNNDSISLNSQQEFHLLANTIFSRAFNIIILKLKNKTSSRTITFWKGWWDLQSDYQKI